MIGCCCTTCSLAQNTREIERVSGTHPGGCCSRPHPELQQKANEKHQNDMMWISSKDPNVKMMEMMVQKQKKEGNDLTKIDDEDDNTASSSSANKSSKQQKQQQQPPKQPAAEADELYSGVAL